MNCRAIISSNLRRLRLLKGLSQDQLASMSKLSRPGYRKIETCESEPHRNTLADLATALNCSVFELLRPIPELKTLRFRTSKLTAQQTNAKKQLISDFAIYLKNYVFLESLIPEKKLAFKLEALLGVTQDPVKMAAKARNLLKLNEDTVINSIFDLLEHAGIKLFYNDFGHNKIFGFSVSSEDGGPAICINCNKKISVERQIFTAAHELGHILLHPESYSGDIADELKADENEANIFASHFLIPDNAFMKKYNEYRGKDLVSLVLSMKSYFRVSYQTILFRINEHNLERDIFPRFYIAYKSKCNHDLKDHYEPNPIYYDSPSNPLESRICLLTRAAYENSLISFNKAAEILRKNSEQMRELTISWRDMK